MDDMGETAEPKLLYVRTIFVHCRVRTFVSTDLRL